MRLIDANALPISKEYCVDEAGFGATFYVAHKDAIDNAPTVDAIPVSWLKEKLTGHPEIRYATTDGICEVLRLWSERERRTK